MLVRDVMKPIQVTFSPHMSWKEAAHALLRHGLSSACVVDERQKLMGIVSEKDLFRGMFPSYGEWMHEPHAFLDLEDVEAHALTAGEKSIADVMSRKLVTTTPATPVLRIGGLMVSSGVHHVPVLEGEVLVGVVGRGDIYRAILGKYAVQT